jgi:hypothetical protein
MKAEKTAARRARRGAAAPAQPGGADFDEPVRGR